VDLGILPDRHAAADAFDALRQPEAAIRGKAFRAYAGAFHDVSPFFFPAAGKLVRIDIRAAN
jgi:hypothetical protein